MRRSANLLLFTEVARQFSRLRDEQRLVANMAENVGGQAYDIQLIAFQAHGPLVRKPARLNRMKREGEP